MKKSIVFITLMLALSSFADTASELQYLREQVSNLTVRVTQLERRRRPMGAKSPTQPKKVRTASRLIVTPTVRENMNILGERFPKDKIRLNRLPKFNNAKPVMVTPKIPDSRAVPEAKKETTEVKK